MQLLNPKGQQDLANPSSLPHLWIPEELRQLTPHLSKHFHLNTPEAKPTPGHHIVALKTERSIRRVLRALQATPETDITIFPAELLLFESPEGLMMKSQPADRWLEITKSGSLEFPDALAIARDALLSLQQGEISQSSWNLEKEELRQRCGVSPFDWNQYIKDLQAEINGAAKLDIVERFKADLLRLAGTDDPIVQLLKISELAATYRMPAGEIRKAIAKVESATRTPKAKFFALDDFLSMEMEGIDYLIPGLLPRGETVLCVGLPKSGKSLLAVDAAFAIATGETNFLGEQVNQGRVLLISVDESQQSTKAKLLKRGFRPSDAANLAVMTSWDISQLDALEAKLEIFRPDLVIIDSLKRITAGREINENSAEFADVLYTLKELIGRYGAASILIHHSNKNPEATGVSKVRGSTAIAGAVWGIWQLEHVVQTTDEKGKPIKGKPKFDPSDPRRIFTAICRDTEGALLNIQFNPENHSYSISEGDESAQSDRKTQEQIILDILAEVAPKGLTGREVMGYSGLGRGVYSVLNRMVDKRLITQRQSNIDTRMTVYCLPNRKGTHTPPHSYPICDQYSSNANTDMDLEIDHKLITTPEKLITNFCKDAQKSDCDQSLIPVTVSDAVEIDHKISTEGGCVCLEAPVTKVQNCPITEELSKHVEAWEEECTVDEFSALVAPHDPELTITPSKSVEAFTLGEQVMVDGIPGIVAQIDLEWPDSPYRVDTETSSSWFAAADIQKFSLAPQQAPQKPPEPKVGDRIQYGEFTGVLAAKGANGWFADWNLCPSLIKRFPAPPALLKDGEFKLI